MDPAARCAGAMALTQSGLRAGFSSWFEFALLAEEKTALMSSAVVALQQRGVRSALNTWMTFAAEHAEARRQLQSAASAFRGDGVHFNTWHELSATLTPHALNAAPPHRVPQHWRDVAIFDSAAEEQRLAGGIARVAGVSSSSAWNRGAS